MSETKLSQLFDLPTPKALDHGEPILIVEDQQDLRLIIVHHLHKLGFRTVVHAPNGLEALKHLQAAEKKPALILCDLEMPVMGGLDLLSELRENPELQRPPFCLTMDNASKEKIMLAVESGVDEVVVKPYTYDDIVPKMTVAFKVFHNPKNPERVYEHAKALWRDKKLDESAKVYSVLAQMAPKAARPLVGLARIAFSKGQDDEALRLLREAEGKNAAFVHLYTLRGGIEARRQHWDAAITALTRAIELSPLNPIRYKAAADILCKERKYRDAIDLLAIAQKNELEFPELHHYLSQAHFALKEFSLAVKHVKSALAHDPDNTTYLNQYGICLKELEHFDEANKVYNSIIKLDPDNEAALYNKAVMLNARGETAEAVRLLERLVKKKPDFTEARQKLAEYSATLGEKKSSSPPRSTPGEA